MMGFPLLRQLVGERQAGLAPNLLSGGGRWKRPAIAILVLAFASGCLWSPDIEEADTEPLYPPQIISEQLEPPQLPGIRVVEESCREVVFSVDIVRELNVRDVLYIRWYEDYDEDAGSLPIRDLYLGSTGEVDRRGTTQLEWTVDISGQPSVWKQTVHTVSVFVADRPYEDAADPTVFSDTEAQFDSMEWTFRLGTGGYCTE
jgi:hypothetical protein